MPTGDLGKIYQDREVIFNQGEDGDCMYVILQGNVEIYQVRDGQEVILGICHPGDFLGEMAVMTKEVRSASARTLGQVRLITIDKKNFLKRVQEDPTIALRLVKGLSNRIRGLNEEISVLNKTIVDCLEQQLIQKKA